MMAFNNFFRKILLPLIWCTFIALSTITIINASKSHHLRDERLPPTSSTSASSCHIPLDGTNIFDWDEHDNITYIDSHSKQLCHLKSFREHPLFLQYFHHDYAIAFQKEMEMLSHVNTNANVNDTTTKHLMRQRALHSEQLQQRQQQQQAQSAIESFTIEPTIKQLKILIIGDSLDQHMCFHLAKEHPTWNRKLPLRCYISSSLKIEYQRIHGIVGVNITEMMQMLTTFHSIDQDIIIFGSVAWDLKNSYDPWCKVRKDLLHDHGASALMEQMSITPLEVHCYCNYTAADVDPTCMSSYTSVQAFLSKRPPWCTLDLFHQYQIALKETISKLQFTFPSALILLRNHPFSASMFMGSENCLGLFNQEIRRVALTECFRTPIESIKSENENENEQPRLLDVHSLMLQGLHHLGTNNGLPLSQHNDHLHYESGVKYWTNYILNAIFDMDFTSSLLSSSETKKRKMASKCFAY